VKVLSLNFTPITYDFERAAEARRRGRANTYSGFATERFGYTVRSDLLPGFDVGVDYSLFEGSLLSDTAQFKPYRESIRASLSLDKNSAILRAIGRLFGIDFARSAAPSDSAAGETVGGVSERIAGINRSIADQPVAGSVNRAALAIPSGRGFNTTLSFSSARQRPVQGAVTIDPFAECEPFRLTNPFAYEQCVLRKTISPGTGNPFAPTTSGGPIFRSPAQTNLQGTMSFNITPKWSAQWSTTYDFREKDFASQIVSLQRELHDWNAIFAFTQSPNGNFAFNFFIALRAQPDLKFNYDRRSLRRPPGTAGTEQQ
jgi:hypothetical protein